MSLRTRFARVTNVVRNHPKKVLAVFVGIAGVVLALSFRSGTDEVQVVDKVRIPTVSVLSVGALEQAEQSLVLLGEVRSVSQAELRVQKPGEVTRVNVKAGAYVSAGTIIAEIENAQERAAVLQAQGAVAAAEAALAKVRGGARSEDRASASAQAASAATGLTAARESARSAYTNAYSTAHDALFSTADSFFTNAYTVRPSFRVNSATYDERSALERERVLLGTMLDEWSEKSQTTISDDAIDAALLQAQSDLARTKTFLDTIAVYVSKQDVTNDYAVADKSADEGKMSGARAAVEGARQSVSGARNALAAAKSGDTSASLAQQKIETGAQVEDIAAAEAAYTQARGVLAGATAVLEQTLIRTPIPGTVATLNVSRGDFASALEVAAVVANPGALEVEAFVSGSARERIVVGMKVLVDGRYDGTVTSAAPGLDPATKKARITVGLPKDATLMNGSFVELALIENGEGKAPTVASSTEHEIPITAIKVLPRGLAVFTVSEENTLVAHEVTEGPIIGSRMLVKEGLTPDMRIVVDVRGLAEGDTVTTANTESE